MTANIIICDDSAMARKQLRKVLPESWQLNVSFAANGLEALELLRQGQGEIIFLDLNMPVMDGYETLTQIRAENLSALVIVVSGDIQAQAHERVMALGALAFIEKPIRKETLAQLMSEFGLDFTAPEEESASLPEETFDADDLNGDEALREGLQEVSNIAMGRSAALLAKLLQGFVQLPIPKVSLLAANELRMALSLAQNGSTYSAVCQGFVGANIAGEALLVFDDSSFHDIASMLNRPQPESHHDELELLMDLGSILVGTCIQGIGQQIDINFCVSHPLVLGQHLKVESLLNTPRDESLETLAVEITFQIENHNVNCELLLLFTPDSIPTLQQRLNILFS